jgi:predicted exporter
VQSVRSGRGWTLLALLWLLLVLAVAAHQWRFWQAGRLDTDVLALLPHDERAPVVDLATRELADRAGRQVIVMLGAADWDAARRAGAAWREALQAAHAPLQPRALGNDASLREALDFYRPWRDRLLTPAQRERLAQAPAAALQQSALAALYQPGAALRLSDWVADPLGLWPQWWAERAGQTRARPRDGELWVAADGQHWLVLGYEVQGSAFRLDGQAVYAQALERAQAAARAVEPSLRMLAAGVPLHAEAAAVRASTEVNTIGWGSLAAVLLLVWLAFRSLRPIVLVALSLLIGVAAALSATALVFGSVHLITLVFGASLVGVAEDYGIHWFATRQGRAGVEPRGLMRRLLPGMALALVTSVLAYAALGIAPFPGLRQMALFSAVGLLAAFLTVVCWFPVLDRTAVPDNRFSLRVAASLAHWPRLRASRRTLGLAALVAVACAAGMALLRTSDDVRQLQNASSTLVQAQRTLGQLLGLPSPAQFYIVQADTAEALLQREEALKARLEPLVREGRLAGWSALSDWVPSAQRQAADAALSAQAETAVLAGVNAALGETLARPGFAAPPLSLAQWLAHPVSSPVRALWLGEAAGRPTSVLMLRGLHDTSLLPALAAAAQGIDGVRWVDKAADIGALLGRYRVSMTKLLLLAHGAVLLALCWRFGCAAWRAWLPAALASVMTVAALGALGQPMQLFNVLALLLLLGVGVDYGIFLLEHRNDGSAWLAVVLGAGSTWLSFGLLGLSATPALRAFGLTLLIGLALVTLLAPCMRPPLLARDASHDLPS